MPSPLDRFFCEQAGLAPRPGQGNGQGDGQAPDCLQALRDILQQLRDTDPRNIADIVDTRHTGAGHYRIGSLDVTSAQTETRVPIQPTHVLHFLSWPDTIDTLNVRVNSRDAPAIDVLREGSRITSPVPITEFYLTTSPNAAGSGDPPVRWLTGSTRVDELRHSAAFPGEQNVRDWPLRISDSDNATTLNIANATYHERRSIRHELTASGTAGLFTNVDVDGPTRYHGRISVLKHSAAGDDAEWRLYLTQQGQATPIQNFDSAIVGEGGNLHYKFDTGLVWHPALDTDLVFEVVTLGPAGNRFGIVAMADHYNEVEIWD